MAQRSGERFEMKKEIYECDLESCHCQIKTFEFMFKIKNQSAIGFNNNLLEFRGIDLRKGQDDLHFCSLNHLLEYLRSNLEIMTIKEWNLKKNQEKILRTLQSENL